MQAEVLIAYVSRSGSTEDVAEAIGVTMVGAGVAADVRPMANVESIPEDVAVVIGTALYAGRFPKEFHRFVVRFRRELGNVRPWIFVLGPTENERKHFAAAEEQARKELAKYPWLQTADVRVMGGSFDPRRLRLPFPFQPGDEAAWESHAEGARFGYSRLGLYPEMGRRDCRAADEGTCDAAGRVCRIHGIQKQLDWALIAAINGGRFEGESRGIRCASFRIALLRPSQMESAGVRVALARARGRARH